MLKTPSIRVDANQGAALFWGFLSAFFFFACCVLLWQQRLSEYSNDQLRDQVSTLTNTVNDLSSERDRLKNDMKEREQQLQDRENILRDQEAKLADRMNNPNPTPDPTIPTNPSQIPPPNPTKPEVIDAKQLAALKKFVFVAHKLVKSPDELSLVAGRPVLRLANLHLFSPGDSTLLPEGKESISHLVAALIGQWDHVDLRIFVYCDKTGDVESGKQKGDPLAFTNARAAAIQRFLHDQTDLPLSHILCVGMADQNPLSSHDQYNRRTEFTVVPTVAPLPANALPPLTALAADNPTAPTTATPAPQPDPLEPPPDATPKP